MSVVKIEIGNKHYEFRFASYGVQMKGETGWLGQGLTFSNIVTLLEMKNESWRKFPTDMAKAQEHWQKEIIRRLQTALKPKRQR